MSDDFLSKLSPVPDTPGSFYVSLKYPDVVPLMKMCKVEKTRQKMEFAFNNRCQKENTPILERLLVLRHEKANLLGYPDHASYILDIRMAKSPTVVKDVCVAFVTARHL
jgi:thimet oligopeptidase